ncbi:MAG: CDP-glucose 4,6-dehydratase [Methanomassiliicoccaceae archaeon]|nr:CDP-glucose 4,6-dehydratase [Methanomassiliicoccaceae archaeon]
MSTTNKILPDFSVLKGKKILITGHTGFKGSWMCMILQTMGVSVYGYALEPPTNPNMFDILELRKSVNSEIGDIRDIEHLNSYVNQVKPDVIIHMAAQPIVLMGYKQPRETYEINVLGTVNVLEVARNCSSVKAVLNVTTDKVYYNNESGDYLKESDRLDGYDPYSNSKSCSELVTGCYRRCFFKDIKCSLVTARAGNVIGGGDFAVNRIIPDCIKYTMNKESIVIRNPNSTRPYQHVLEPLFAYLLIISAQLRGIPLSDSYNIGPDYNGCVTSGELATLFCNHWGPGASWTSQNGTGPHEANYLRLDTDLIKSDFLIKHCLTIDDAIRLTVEWTKSAINEEDIVKTTKSQIKYYFGLFKES